MLPSRRRLSNGLYRVEGAAKLKVLEGCFYALGRYFREGDELIIPKGSVICINVRSECVAEGFIAGSIDEAKPEEEVIYVWESLSNDLTSRKNKIMVIGEPDSGKTTFSTFLVNTALSKGLKVAFIDADIGQNDIGWPGTIALALLTQPLSWLGELESAAIYFVGSNTPNGCEDIVLVGVRKILEKTTSCNLTVINTDGWITGKRAILYKARFVETVNPDALVVMRGAGSADCIGKMFEHSGIDVIYAPTPPKVKCKDKELRKIRRDLAYLDFLLNSSVKYLKLDKVKFYGTYTLNLQPDSMLEKFLDSLLGFEVWVESSNSIVVLAVNSEQAYKRALEMREQLSKTLGKEVYISNI
ncbi:MAG: Clp1/GlmU family protein, partial [Thermofilaceae archaeon]